MRRKTCTQCDKRDTCVSLCERMQEYVSQDHVPMYEQLHSSKNVGELVAHDDAFSCGYDTFYNCASRLKRVIILMSNDGKDIDTIRYHVSTEEREIRRILRNYHRNYNRYKSIYRHEAIIDM